MDSVREKYFRTISIVESIAALIPVTCLHFKLPVLICKSKSTTLKIGSLECKLLSKWICFPSLMSDCEESRKLYLCIIFVITFKKVTEHDVFLFVFSLQGLTKERMRQWNLVSTNHCIHQSTRTYLASWNKSVRKERILFSFNCSWQADTTMLPQFGHVCSNNDVI